MESPSIEAGVGMGSVRGGGLSGWRRWSVWVVAAVVAPLVLTAAPRVLTAAPPAAAGPLEGTGYIWGPAGSWLDMQPPLNDARVFKAITMAVDGDTISERLLGESGLVLSVDDASPRTVVTGGSSVFLPEQSRSLLEDAGVTDLTLTIAGDSAVPLTAQIAEAIASDLKANIGAQVTVVEGDADFLVRQAELTDVPPPEPYPPPPLPPGTVSFEVTCTPDTFQPDVWVAMECSSRLTNNGQSPLSDVTVNIGATIGVVPAYYWMWYIRDGQYTPIGTLDLSFGEAGALQPGQTTMSRLVVLLRMSEGTYETTDTVDVGGRTGVSIPVKLTASSTAAAPSRDLLVTKELVGGPAGEEAAPTATYETRITNQGSSAVTELRVIDRYAEYLTFVGSEPAPSTQNPAVQLASWDLASFGKDSLAPGESLVLTTTYGPTPDAPCGYVMPGVVVEATVDGQQRRYGARSDDEAMVGDCQDAGRPGGGDGGASVGDGQGGGEGIPGGGGGGPPVAPAATGEGPTPCGNDLWWTAALAAVGASLVGAALALRRRTRLGRRIYW